MTTLEIKNLPDELYQKLKERAKEQRRSIADEAIAILSPKHWKLLGPS